MVTVRTTPCRGALHRTGIPGMDYVVNPYRGCQHGCLFCYAQERGNPPRGPWGEVVEVKSELEAALARELASRRPGKVLLSSIADPYQPIESKAKKTRAALSLLLNSPFRVTILTRSPRVLDDLDLLKPFRDLFGAPRLKVGFSLPLLDERWSKLLEPHAPPPEARLEALSTLARAGIPTWAFVAPIVPGVNDSPEILAKTFAALAATGTREIELDPLTFYRVPVARLDHALRAQDRSAHARFRAAQRDRRGWSRWVLSRAYPLRDRALARAQRARRRPPARPPETNETG